MAKVVAPGDCLQMNGVSKAKRKTPAELRGEQLKRTCFVDQAKESFDALRPCRSTEKGNGLKNPKYIEMRMNELYPVKKARSWMPSGKENAKENGVKEQFSNLFNVSLLSNVAAIKRQQLTRDDNNASTRVSDDSNTEARQTYERRSQSIFRSVTELSKRGEELSCLPDIDMSKALKGLATCVPLPVYPGDISEKSDTASLSGNFVPEFHVPGREIPLDLSMKTYVRLVSSSPLNWLHRSILASTYNGMPQLRSMSCNVVNQDNSSGSGSDVGCQVLNSMSLQSWVYPQSTLPPSMISAYISSGPGEGGFLQQRQLAWEDAFRSLYYMFRKNLCKIFYVCTSQFVAMFTGSCESGGVKRSCNAYITQSTRRLRAMLKDHDICYSMPLCKTKMDETTVEDLVELSEIENHNLGQMQSRRLRSDSNIDNTPESFLAFDGNESVHGLYDLLLNYRSSLGFLLTADVPVLYSPVPFQNAAMSSPKIDCKEMVTTECTSCYMVEAKGEFLPPWIISNICAHVTANGQNFEASFVTDPTSVNLNMGLPQIPDKTEPESLVTEGTGETNDAASDIPGAVIFPQLRSGHLKSLKYCNNSYTVSLSPS